MRKKSVPWTLFVPVGAWNQHELYPRRLIPEGVPALYARSLLEMHTGDGRRGVATHNRAAMGEMIAGMFLGDYELCHQGLRDPHPEPARPSRHQLTVAGK